MKYEVTTTKGEKQTFNDLEEACVWEQANSEGKVFNTFFSGPSFCILRDVNGNTKNAFIRKIK